MGEVDYEALSEYQDILEEVLNGRTEGHRCPACGKGIINAIVEEDVRVRLECPNCGKYVEARLG